MKGVVNMDISNIKSSYAGYNVDNTKKPQNKAQTGSKTGEEAGAVYERSSGTDVKKAAYQADNAKLIEQMKSDLATRKNQLMEMVQGMLGKQSETFKVAMSETDIYKALREGNFKADPETIAKAKEDISENGYWGVEQTSERMLSFAKALSGNDPSKGSQLLEAFKKGFEEATKAWGDTLPEISQKTYEATIQKFEKWMNGEG